MFIKSHKFNNKFSKPLNIHRYSNTNNNSNNYLLNSQIKNICRQIEPNSLLTQRELSNTYISKVQNTYHQTILQASLQKSHEDTGKRNNTLFGIPNRFYIPNKSRVILYDGPFYDCAKIEIDTRYDTNTKEHIIIISEHKIPTDHFDSEDLRTILSLADTNNGFIAGLGNVFLNNTFDKNHIYNMHNFDLKHGEGAFHTAMIKCIVNRTNTE